MPSFRIVMLWLHLSAIVVWLGGLFAIPLVAAPAIRNLLSASDSQALIERLARRFLRFSRELILIIFLTGLFNLLNIGYVSQFAFSDRFLWIVSAKLGLLLVMAANQVWYSLRLLPNRRRTAATWSATANVILAAVVLYLGVILRGG